MISDACPQLPPTICMKLIHVVSNSRENFRCVAPCSFFSMTAVSFKKIVQNLPSFLRLPNQLQAAEIAGDLFCLDCMG